MFARPMAKIVLHRLTDWPVFRHVRPLLDALEVEPESLGFWHFFSTSDPTVRKLVDAAPEREERPEETEPLLALGESLADLGRSFIAADEDDQLHVAFHDCASQEVLRAAAKKGKHEVVLAAELVGKGEPSPDYLLPLLDEWEAASVQQLLKGAPKGSSKEVLRYVDAGGARPDLPSAPDVTLELYRDISSWTERHLRVLDVFVALSGARACPRWPSNGEKGAPSADAAGLLRDALVARGVSEVVVFDEVCASAPPGSGQRPYGHTKWESRAYLQASFYARLDEVVAWGPGKAAALFRAHTDLPDGLRVLAGMVAEKWCREGGFAKLDLPALDACSYLDDHESGDDFVKAAALLYRERVLSRGDATLAQLIDITEDLRKTGKLPAADAKRFQAALKPALDREDSTLGHWERARDLKLVDQATFAKGVIAPFRRALAAEFKAGEHGFGDQDGFMVAAKDVAAVDPDLCLRGWAALTLRFNENGLRGHLADWDRALPKSGFSKAAIAEVAAAFSSPTRRSAAKILKKVLAARKIEIVQSAPPKLESVDATFEVGTDVAHLIVGSWSGVEAVSNLEDPDDWAAAMKKQKCIGLETGGDGGYTVRVKGVAPGTAAKKVVPKARHVATFPLGVADDTLTVSGIVGAGGTPTISFPSGTYVADVLQSTDGVVVVVIAAADKAPKWTFKNDLPHL
jgi:hypothetical protein